MHTTNLRKVGGSLMLTIPPALLKGLDLNAGSKVEVAIEKGRLVVKPQHKPHYSLEKLLAQCDPKAAHPKKDREWTGSKPAGRELL